VPASVGLAQVQCYVLARNRVALLEKALHSILKCMPSHSVQLVVSDNSTTEDVRDFMRVHHPCIPLVCRRPSLGFAQHMAAVLQEAQAEYIVMLHDDDELRPGFFEALAHVLNAQPQLAAVACNATILEGDTPTTRLVMGHCPWDVQLPNGQTLVATYLRMAALGPAPFPAYMYRRSALQGLWPQAAQGGKHCDVSFLMHVANRGGVYWLAKPYMAYRVHAHNDNAIEHIPDRLSLLRAIYRHTCFTPHSALVRGFQWRYWWRWYRALSLPERHRWPWRVRCVRRFVGVGLVRYALGSAGFWARVFYRARR
jgi:hypothetical protein